MGGGGVQFLVGLGSGGLVVKVIVHIEGRLEIPLRGSDKGGGKLQNFGFSCGDKIFQDIGGKYRIMSNLTFTLFMK